MAQYKVGDRVVVRTDLIAHRTYYMEGRTNGDSVTEQMNELAGQVVTISRVGEKYRVEEDSHSFNWTDGMFIGLESEVYSQPIDTLSDIKALFD